MERLSTLCYIEQDGKYLMLHRTVKENDVNKDKWIGVGGHFEYGESPEECLLREVKEETGYTLTSWKYRGIVTFVYGEDTVEYMSLYTADGFTGEPVECDEGELEWVDKKDIPALELWEGDKIFFRLLDMGREFFSLKLVYDRQDVLEYAALDGVLMELFDEIREDGSRTGVVKERGVVHEDGTLHATVHIWIVRPNDKSGYDLLLQKRSECKDSNPGCWDISSAGHIEAGHGYLESALRELREELGINARPEQLREIGTRRCGRSSPPGRSSPSPAVWCGRESPGSPCARLNIMDSIGCAKWPARSGTPCRGITGLSSTPGRWARKKWPLCRPRASGWSIIRCALGKENAPVSVRRNALSPCGPCSHPPCGWRIWWSPWARNIRMKSWRMSS